MLEYEKTDTLAKWKLFQYVSGAGRPAIEDWRNHLQAGKPKAYLDTFLRDIVKKAVWEWPDLDMLHGEYRGLSELRWKCDRVPHRIFGYQIAEFQYLMLIGCTHRESYDPPNALDTALLRQEKIKRGESKYVDYRIISGR